MADEHSGGFVAYYRVSTAQQGKSGLGIEAQQAAVKSYLNGGRWNLVAEFTEAESGRRRNRPELERALAAARLHRVPLIVAKVDRLSRSAHFLSQLLEAGVDVLFCDLPKIEGPTGRFLLRQMASVAELEADMISSRTKAALAAAKARGAKLGGSRSTKLTDSARAMGRAVIAGRARRQAADVAPTINALRASGVKSLRAIAAELNKLGIPTAGGRGGWHAVQVLRVLGRL
jgi:DNA invertase Pin-like site-specific DNA recombinase